MIQTTNQITTFTPRERLRRTNDSVGLHLVGMWKSMVRSKRDSTNDEMQTVIRTHDPNSQTSDPTMMINRS